MTLQGSFLLKCDQTGIKNIRHIESEIRQKIQQSIAVCDVLVFTPSDRINMFTQMQPD